MKIVVSSDPKIFSALHFSNFDSTAIFSSYESWVSRLVTDFPPPGLVMTIIGLGNPSAMHKMLKLVPGATSSLDFSGFITALGFVSWKICFLHNFCSFYYQKIITFRSSFECRRFRPRAKRFWVLCPDFRSVNWIWCQMLYISTWNKSRNFLFRPSLYI